MTLPLLKNLSNHKCVLPQLIPFSAIGMEAFA